MHRAAVLNSQISEDLSQPSEQDNDSQQSVEQRFIPKVDRNLNYEPNFCHIVINLAFTNYPVVKQVAKSLGMWTVEDKEETDWDVCWTDHPIGPETFIRMHFHQTINYLPGIHTIARKNELGKRLNAMQAAIPVEYSFHPQTWMLPDDFSQLRRHMEGPGKRCTYIVKPEAACQGRGIYLVNRLDDIAIGQHCVVQKYIDNPLLIDSYKFDLRVYVLVGSIEPLRIYLYHDGLARFATEAYTAANRQNFKSSYQHLTNYAINKFNPKFKAALTSGDEEGGFKRSLKAAFKTLAENGVDIEKLWQKIQQIAVKTVILGYEKMRKNYVSCQPEEYHNHMAFHILGLDIFIDDQCEPHLLEVNHTPSFATETHLDSRIKTALIRDTLVLMRCQDLALKQELFSKSKTYSSNRIQNGIRQTYQQQSRTALVEQQSKKRLEYETHNRGGYKVIYPCEDDEMNKKYASLICKAREVLDPKKVVRKNSILSQGEFERLRQKYREREKEKEKEIDRDRLKDKIKEEERARLKKKISDIKTKAQAINSSRGPQQEPQIRKTITTFIRKESTIPTEQLNHISLLTNFQHNNSKLKQNRAFTIKTKYSIPQVNFKPPVRQIDAGPSLVKKEVNKFRVDMTSNSKGAFIKPKIYDVPSLVITNYAPEEQKIIRKKNREGKLIFHVSKT